MPKNLPQKLADFQSKGYVIAPAGYGKTHLIALAVNAGTNRQLILTHTFAGVNSIKVKMSRLGVPTSRYQVDTIASWSLRLCLAYPETSEWTVETPSGKEWNELYGSCCRLLTKVFVRRVISATYSGIYVDEYQDCNESQHVLICSLAEFLPCRILGDPLQAIFDFAENPVNWEKSIYPHFEWLGQLETPWRWHNAGADELGAWLKQARETLDAGNKINLNTRLPKGVTRLSVDLDNFSDTKRYAIFYRLMKSKETVIGIHSGSPEYKNKTHALARALGGGFSSIEEVEGKDLFAFLKKLESAKTTKAAFLHILEFSKKCFTGVDGILAAGTKKGEKAKKTKATKYPLILTAANSYLTYPNSRNLRDILLLIKTCPETSPYRRDLCNRFLQVLTISINNGTPSLMESAHAYQREFRHSGRPIRFTKLLGTTLLVKGLEYDHAVILDADSLGLKELYVAMTRGSKSVTFITKGGLIPNDKAIT